MSTAGLRLQGYASDSGRSRETPPRAKSGRMPQPPERGALSSGAVDSMFPIPTVNRLSQMIGVHARGRALAWDVWAGSLWEGEVTLWLKEVEENRPRVEGHPTGQCCSLTPTSLRKAERCLPSSCTHRCSGT